MSQMKHMEPRVGDSRSLFHRPVLLQNDPAMFQRVDEKQQLPSRILLARLRPLLRNNRSNPRIRLRHTRFFDTFKCLEQVFFTRFLDAP